MTEYKKLWRLNCSQLAKFDGAILAKDAEIVEMKSRLSHTGRLTPSDLPPMMKMQGKCSGEDPMNLEGEPHL